MYLIDFESAESVFIYINAQSASDDSVLQNSPFSFFIIITHNGIVGV
jgi:hypothetical protein